MLKILIFTIIVFCVSFSSIFGDNFTQNTCVENNTTVCHQIDKINYSLDDLTEKINNDSNWSNAYGLLGTLLGIGGVGIALWTYHKQNRSSKINIDELKKFRKYRQKHGVSRSSKSKPIHKPQTDNMPKKTTNDIYQKLRFSGKYGV